MVVAGNFSARLVDAVTKMPFKEHVGPNGQIFTEVEPEAQYLVEIQVVGGDQKAVFHCFIDGKRLPNTITKVPRMAPHFWGLNDSTTGEKMAFCFRTPTILEGENSSEPVGVMGSVTVQASEIVPLGSKPQRKFTQEVFRPPSRSLTQSSASLTCATTSTNNNNNNGNGKGNGNNGGKENVVKLPFMPKKQEKKVLRTVAGNIVESTRKVAPKKATTNRVNISTTNKAPSIAMQVGDILQEININYCTALGLIYAGILTKPPLWEQHRLTRGLKEEERAISEPMAPSKKIKIDAIYAGDTMISDAKEVEFFDLTSSED